MSAARALHRLPMNLVRQRRAWALAMGLALSACGGGGGGGSTPNPTTPTPVVDTPPPVVQPVAKPPVLGTLAWPMNLEAGRPAQMKLLATDPDGGAITWTTSCGAQLKCKLDGDTLSLDVDPTAPLGQSQVQVTATNAKGLKSIAERNVIVWSRTLKDHLGSIAGSPERAGLHLVILGDGFTAAEQPVFHQAAYELLVKFASLPEIAAHLGAWNIHVGEVDAGASGIPRTGNHPPVPPPLGSELGCQGIVRLLCPNAGLALPMAAKLVPHYTKVMVIGNTTDYAGAGGDVSTVSLAPEARDVGVHELGHSFAGLADEYTDLQVNYPYSEGTFPNITTFSTREQVPWRIWIDADRPVPTPLPPETNFDAVGVYHGGYYRDTGYYRPTIDSFMRSLGKNIGAVNGEAWARNVYSQGGAWAAVEPTSGITLQRSAQPAGGWVFKATPLLGPKIVETRWFVNDVERPEKRGATQFQWSGTEPAAIRVDLVDLTGRVRLYNSVVAGAGWSIQ